MTQTVNFASKSNKRKTNLKTKDRTKGWRGGGGGGVQPLNPTPGSDYCLVIWAGKHKIVV